MQEYSNRNSLINNRMIAYINETIPQSLQKKLEEKFDTSTRKRCLVYDQIRFNSYDKTPVPNEEYIEKEKSLKLINNKGAITLLPTTLKKQEQDLSQLPVHKREEFLKTRQKNLYKEEEKKLKVSTIREAGKKLIGLSMERQDYSYLDSNFYLLGHEVEVGKNVKSKVKK